MSGVVKLSDPDNLIRRYVAGESVHKLAREQGVSQGTISRLMKKAGVFQDRSEFRIPLDSAAIAERYLAGESEKAIAVSLGVSRLAIRRRLLSFGIQPRGRSEAELLKWSQMAPDARAQQVAAAHDAARGRTVSYDQQLSMARGKERTQSQVVTTERQLAEMLAARGYPTTLQKAVDIYNIDVAIDIPPIAVEIYGGMWHNTGNHKRRFFERTKHLLDSDWSVVIIWVDGRRYPLGIGSAEYVVALAQELGRNPTAGSQYRVILGNGQDAPITNYYLNHPAVIERLRGSRQPSGDNHLITG